MNGTGQEEGHEAIDPRRKTGSAATKTWTGGREVHAGDGSESRGREGPHGLGNEGGNRKAQAGADVSDTAKEHGKVKPLTREEEGASERPAGTVTLFKKGVQVRAGAPATGEERACSTAWGARAVACC